MDFFFDVGMAVCPVIGYVLQYRLILQNESVGAFSIDICLVLLIANILRLNFYPFQRFETALIFQSLFMIAAQLVLLHVCSSFKDEGETQPSTARSSDEVNTEYFWRWNSFRPYWQWTLLFAGGTALISLVMLALGIQIYGELIGLVALLTQSVLILPQILQIYKIRRVEGISHSLIMLNFLGDTFKTFYFFYNSQPFQFKLCGIIQLVLDVFVMAQIGYYILKVKIDEMHQQSKEEEILKQKELSPKQEVISDELDGTLSQTAVAEEQLENIDNEQNKTETDTNLS